jgi:hypothetical protein
MKALTERDWQSQVLDLARVGGWKHYHTHNARRSPSGFPDLVLIRAPELIYVELKTAIGKLSIAQEWWTENLRDCGQEIHVWRPVDFRAAEKRLLSRPAA